MGHFLLSTFLLLAVLVPNVSIAQVYHLPSAPPLVNAASAPWQVAGDPIFYAGSFYYPAGATVYFDGDVMNRTGVYLGVPLYEDATIEPYSIVFVPTGGNLMRPYERRREGDLAGTAGSRTPSFPIQRGVELSVAPGSWYQSGSFGYQRRGFFGPEPIASAEPMGTVPEHDNVAVGGMAVDNARAVAAPPPAVSLPTGIQSIPGPAANAGVWIPFDGARWYSDGMATSYDADRFEPFGNYRGFPVYRETGGSSDRIFVTVVQGGPLAPFVRR